jgi:hypothetical protein
MDFAMLNAINRAKQSLMMSSNRGYQRHSVVVELNGLNKTRLSRKGMITRRTTSYLSHGMVMVYNFKYQLIIADPYADVEMPEPPSHNLYQCEWVGGEVPKGLVSSFLDEAINLGLITKDDFPSPVVSVFTARTVVGWWLPEETAYRPVYRLKEELDEAVSAGEVLFSSKRIEMRRGQPMQDAWNVFNETVQLTEEVSLTFGRGRESRSLPPLGYSAGEYALVWALNADGLVSISDQTIDLGTETAPYFVLYRL